jgi:hypothetical protein
VPGRRGEKIRQRGITETREFKGWAMDWRENLFNRLLRFCTSVVNSVRNSSGVLTPPGIILTFNPSSEQRSIISKGVTKGSNWQTG